MKFIKEENRDDQDLSPRYYFAVGQNEARLLLGLLEKAYIHTPKMLETLKVLNSMGNMKSVIAKAIKEMPAEEYKDRVPLEVKEEGKE